MKVIILAVCACIAGAQLRGDEVASGAPAPQQTAPEQQLAALQQQQAQNAAGGSSAITLQQASKVRSHKSSEQQAAAPQQQPQQQAAPAAPQQQQPAPAAPKQAAPQQQQQPQQPQAAPKQQQTTPAVAATDATPAPSTRSIGRGLQVQGDHPEPSSSAAKSSSSAASAKTFASDATDTEGVQLPLFRKRPTKLGLKITSCTVDRVNRRKCVQEQLTSTNFKINMTAVADCLDTCEARKAGNQSTTTSIQLDLPSDIDDETRAVLTKFEECTTKHKMNCVKDHSTAIKFDDDYDVPVSNWGKGAWAANRDGDWLRKLLDYAKTCPGAERCLAETRAIGEDIMRDTAGASSAIRSRLCKAHAECSPGKQCQSERAIVKAAACECTNNANSMKSIEACDNAEASAARARVKSVQRITAADADVQVQTQRSKRQAQQPHQGGGLIFDQPEKPSGSGSTTGRSPPGFTTIDAPRRHTAGPKHPTDWCRDNGADEVERPLICANNKNN